MTDILKIKTDLKNIMQIKPQVKTQHYADGNSFGVTPAIYMTKLHILKRHTLNSESYELIKCLISSL